MTKEMYTKIAGYKTVMAIIKEMLDSQIITLKDYDNIDTIIAKKYGISSCSIFR